MRKLPTSGSETPYTPHMFPRRMGNCYSFAIGRRTRDHKLQPGELAGASNRANPSSSCAALSNLMARDAAAGKVAMYRAAAGTRCRPGFYKIASALDPGRDYHFYRQMGAVTVRPRRGASASASASAIARAFGAPPSSARRNRGGSVTVRGSGAWAHKRGLATGAVLEDACGRAIKDPRAACRSYGDLDYRRFCEFWCVMPRGRRPPNSGGGARPRRPRGSRGRRG